MPTTTTRGFSVPSLTGDGSDIHAFFQALADSIEAYLDGDVEVGGALSAGSGLVAGGSHVPVSGSGVEIGVTGGVGYVQAENRSGGVTLPLHLSGLPARLFHINTKVLETSSTGVDFPLGLTGKRMDSPYFRAYRSSSVATTGGTVLFNSETDPNGWYNPATGLFLPTLAGMYRFSWAVSLATIMTAGDYLRSFVQVNNGALVANHVGYQTGSTFGAISHGTGLAAMNGSTDTLKVVMSTTSGASVTVDGGDPGITHFEAERIGA